MANNYKNYTTDKWLLPFRQKVSLKDKLFGRKRRIVYPFLRLKLQLMKDDDSIVHQFVIDIIVFC